MSNIKNLRGGITTDQLIAFNAMCDSVSKAVGDAKDAGVPQGLIVSVLHGHAHHETAEMIYKE